MPETELEKAERQLAQAKARVQSIKAREASKQRKLDTRRKIILGGALMQFAETEPNLKQFIDRTISNLTRDADKKAFDGWSLHKTKDT